MLVDQTQLLLSVRETANEEELDPCYLRTETPTLN